MSTLTSAQQGQNQQTCQSEQGKPMGPKSYPKNYRQALNAEHRRNSHLQGNGQQLAIQY